MGLRFKSVLAYGLAGYCMSLVGTGFFLMNYPWPSDSPSLAIIEETLPPDAWVDSAPPNFKAIRDIASRKEAFFQFFQPLIDQENQRLLEQREILLQLKERAAHGKLRPKELALLEEWRTSYSVAEAPPAVVLQRLERRINQIPAAMALAQAASESAWGTSRFAREGNNYFGQWCFKPGCGMVPNRRREGASHEVATFASARESVRAYFLNINSHSAYHELRVLRQEKTAKGEPLTGYELVGALQKYSERGETYIEELRSIIRVNHLEPDIPAQLLLSLNSEDPTFNAKKEPNPVTEQVK